ncbi:Response regulator protein VraR [Paenibacillus solanacearum]|uniref:Response regulator protein VraR n=1 Tax=Paenibacillus solanacearum TaxID=2048548 RepID=A0A916K6G5_9BACL|nr:response regulator transcription factor [Paenibacillus solanacearum]CAG7638903.1 Response regulator protein VraR [Paenibacillus solanacearum]
MEKLKVLFVEDDPDWQEGIRNYLEGNKEIDLFSIASTAEECFAVLRQERVDVVLMDIFLGDRQANGLDVTLDITIQFPNVKVIMLTSLDKDDDIFNEAFMNGAYEYIYKHEFELLPDTIVSAKRNGTHKIGERLRKLVYEKKKSLLSKGDRELLKLITAGKTQAEISERLCISLAGVKKHIGRLMKKFQWRGTSKELADKCRKWGLLE